MLNPKKEKNIGKETKLTGYDHGEHGHTEDSKQLEFHFNFNWNWNNWSGNSNGATAFSSTFTLLYGMHTFVWKLSLLFSNYNYKHIEMWILIKFQRELSNISDSLLNYYWTY